MHRLIVRSFLDYLPFWQANDMKKKDRKPVAHAELFEAVQSLLNNHDLTLYWKKIPGHSKQAGTDKQGNDLADT